MRILLSILLILISSLIVMFLLPINVAIKFNIDQIQLRINWIFKIRLNVEKLMTSLTNPEVKKSKTKMDKAFLKGILLRELKILFITGEDDEKLLYINSLITIAAPVVQELLENNKTQIYYKGRKAMTSWLEVSAKLIICPIYIISIYVKSRRKCKHEEKRINRAS